MRIPAGREELEEILLDIALILLSARSFFLPVDGKISFEKICGGIGGALWNCMIFFLYYMLALHFEPSKCTRIARMSFAGKIHDNATILKWLKNFSAVFPAAVQRSCLPDGPKWEVWRYLHRDLRMPSDARATLWLKEIEGLQAGKMAFGIKKE